MASGKRTERLLGRAGRQVGRQVCETLSRWGSPQRSAAQATPVVRLACTELSNDQHKIPIVCVCMCVFVCVAALALRAVMSDLPTSYSQAP